MAIGYAVAPSRLGWLLAAGTTRGLRAVEFGSSAAALTARLRRGWPGAAPDAAVEPWLAALLRYLDGRDHRLDIPLDVAGTPFQERAWRELRAIPFGETRSYGEIGAAIGAPDAREVGQACAANPVALVTPCHRVVRRDGSPGGYRWGAWRKRALLAGEADPPAVAAIGPSRPRAA